MNTKCFCSFYASEAHLVTMLLPYMKQKMEERYEIKIFSEQDLTEVSKKIIDNILSKEENESLRRLEWKDDRVRLNKSDKKVITIVGSEEYMNKIKNKINENLNPQDIVIDCFEYNKSEDEILEILRNHSKIVNTRGESAKDDLFTQFTQKARKCNKEITIMK